PSRDNPAWFLLHDAGMPWLPQRCGGWGCSLRSQPSHPLSLIQASLSFFFWLFVFRVLFLPA
ncbi:hypothetical protein D6158_36485, partial [Nocardia seriolae]